VDNPAIRNLSNAPSFFATTWAATTTQDFGRTKNVNFYRPVATLSFAVDHALFGPSPVMFRLVNDVLHALTTVMMFLLLTTIGLSTLASIAASLLFAVHPVHTEVLAVTAYRTEVLSALFFLAALLVHRRLPKHWAGHLLVPVLAALAFFSKESAAPLPLVMIAMDVALDRKIGQRTAVARYLPVFAVLAGYMAIRSALVTTAPGSPFLAMGPEVVALTMVRTVVLYVRMLLVPWPLCAYYDLSIWPPVDDPFDPLVVLGALLSAIYVGAAVLAWRRDRRAAALFLLVPLVMAPYMHFVPFRTIAGERFLYLASAALFGLLGMAFDAAFKPRSSSVKPLGQAGMAFDAALKQSSVPLRRWALVAGLAVLAALSGLTALRNVDWRNNRTILEAKVRDFPESFDAHFALGRHLLEADDDPSAALPHLERACQIWPGFERCRQILDQARSASDRLAPRNHGSR